MIINPAMNSNLLQLWNHISVLRRKQLWLLFVLMVAASFAEVLSIGAVLPFISVLTEPEKLYNHAIGQQIIQTFNIADPKNLLFILAISFSLAVLISGVMRLVLLWAQTKLSNAIGADLSISIYTRTLYQPFSVHAARNSSEVIAGVSQKTNEVVYLTILPILVILSSIIMMLSILGALILIEPIVALSAFTGFGLIYAGIIGGSKKILAKNSERVNFEQNQVIKALQEGLGGIRDVLIGGTQETYCKIYRKADLSLRRARVNIHIIAGSPRYVIEALGIMLIVILAYTLAVNMKDFSHTIPVLGALALGAQRLLPVLQQTYSNWTYIRGGQASLKAALDLLDQPIPEYAVDPHIEPIQFNERIELEGLSFRYAQKKPWVLKEIELSIQKGSRVGFIGSTGSGKSTLLDIIMGLLQPSKGNLKIDGETITPENQRPWQLRIAHVPQSIFLADTTIAENIAFGIPNEKIDLKRVREVAQKAQIAETIEGLDQQYETLVGEAGIRLSGGQKQRIGIARAFYKQADVIIFDEATSALDSETELAVMESIENIGKGITVLIIAHRITTLKTCNQIVELNNGVIDRICSYQDIIKRD